MAFHWPWSRPRAAVVEVLRPVSIPDVPAYPVAPDLRYTEAYADLEALLAKLFTALDPGSAAKALDPIIDSWAGRWQAADHRAHRDWEQQLKARIGDMPGLIETVEGVRERCQLRWARADLDYRAARERLGGREPDQPDDPDQPGQPGQPARPTPTGPRGPIPLSRLNRKEPA